MILLLFQLKHFVWLLTCVTIMAAFGTCLASSVSLASPDGKNEIVVTIDAEGTLTYEVKREGRTVVDDAPLGLVRSDADFSTGLTVIATSEQAQYVQHYSLVTGNTTTVGSTIQRRSIRLKDPGGHEMYLDLVASDDGVAFRYRFADESQIPRTVQAELTGFNLPVGTRAWMTPYHEAGEHTPNNEDYYFNVKAGDPPPDSRAKARGWGMPALFDARSAQTWALILEVGVDQSYCGTHLINAARPGQYRIAFANDDEVYQGVPADTPNLPTWKGPWSLPWRVILLGDPAQMYSATLMTDVAEPSKVRDTSWIRPGRSAWGWLTHREGPNDTEFFNRFTDLAVKYGWEYTTFDGGWWDTDLKTISQYARQHDVLPIVWWYSKETYDPTVRREKLDWLADQGAAGVKIDFWASEKQGAMAAIEGVLADAAERRMVVVLHGCPVPRGWERTWPNLLSCEAVLGLEGYIYDPHYADRVARYNTVLPFTRNLAGPMDNTPFLLTRIGQDRKTSASHELATLITVTSGVIHLADSPSAYAKLPQEVQSVLRDVPARWDESRCLIGEPGRVVVLARRVGRTWFIAGLNGDDKPVPVSLDLKSMVPHQPDSIQVLSEGDDPLLDIKVQRIKWSDTWRHRIPVSGGFVLRIDLP